MILITQIDSMNHTMFDHIKCPKCNARLCGKPAGTRVRILRFTKAMSKSSPLAFTCKKCGNHYLLSYDDT